LAEDSPVNQRLAVGVLNGRGHSVQVVNNGQEAVLAVSEQAFDLVLMDVQMPTMDGLEATRRIRQAESETGKHVPIMAMTAHAMPEDRETCLEAGMDEYVAKPIRAANLIDQIDRLLGVASPGKSDSATVLHGTIVDWSAAMGTVDGDHELLKEVIQAYFEEAPRLLAGMANAIESTDRPTLKRCAHTFKGSMRFLGAKSLYDVALQLEQAAADQDLAETLPMLERLTRDARRLEAELREYVKSHESTN
jgi:CheY-like chemotaxis protein/HPt (histidine-containing phosphotransfer) domain-containing protein